MRNFVFDLRSCDSLPPVGSAPHTQPTKTYLVWPQAVWLASSPSRPPRVLCLGHHVYVVPSYCRTFTLLLTLSRIFLPRLLTPEPLSHLLLIWVSAGVVCFFWGICRRPVNRMQDARPFSLAVSPSLAPCASECFWDVKTLCYQPRKGRDCVSFHAVTSTASSRARNKEPVAVNR